MDSFTNKKLIVGRASMSKSKYTSASDVGAVKRCPMFLHDSLINKYSKSSMYAIKKGNKVHESVTNRVIAKERVSVFARFFMWLCRLFK